MHVLQYNDRNLALANMAKSANDNMMTRPQLRGVLAPLTPPAYCHGLGTEFPRGSRGKAPVGGLDWVRVPEA